MSSVFPECETGDGVPLYEFKPGDASRFVAEQTVIGKGSFSVVRQARDTQTGEACVLKQLSKTAQHHVYFTREVQALAAIACPAVPRLLGAFETSTHYCLALERRRGQDGFAFLTTRKDFRLEASEAKLVTYRLLCALRCAHDAGIAHRDVKLENILLEERTLETTLIDYGLSHDEHTRGKLCYDFCGSVDYAAVEILRKERAYEGKPADIWSLGAVVFILIFGLTPFNRRERQKAIQRRKPHPLVLFPENADELAVDLVASMLTEHVPDRPSVHEALEHPWLAPIRKRTDPMQLMDETSR